VMPSGWSTTDIGNVGAAGSATGGGGSFTLTGAGADIWGSADAFRYAYTTLTGDGSVVARVSSVQNVDAWTKAGVMMRETLGAGSRHAAMFVSPGKGLAFQRRTATGGTSTHTSGGTGTAPAFVRLTRTGNSFTAHRSADGVTWTLVGSETIPMGSTIQVGVAVTSHAAGVLATAGFESVVVQTAPASGATPPPSGTASTLKVLHWNIHHGVGTDGKYNIDRLASWIAEFKPDVVSLNEVEKHVGSYGNEDQPARFAAMLSARTGTTWYHHFAQRYGKWTSNGQGNVILSRVPIQSTGSLALSCSRSVALVQITVNGRPVSVASTHLDDGSSSCRTTQVAELLAWAANYPEGRILAGDYNAQSSSTQIATMKQTYVDAWAAAKSLGTTTNYSGNCDGCTRNSRIDYVFTSQGAGSLVLKSAHVFDTRDAAGHMPSDHKPLMVVYEVK
jgi:endonuclease/exonuclease/phosphatase family metal-dependent hydrolase